jgi:hypothetical protein
MNDRLLRISEIADFIAAPGFRGLYCRYGKKHINNKAMLNPDKLYLQLAEAPRLVPGAGV